MKKLAIQLFVIGTIIATYALPVLAMWRRRSLIKVLTISLYCETEKNTGPVTCVFFCGIAVTVPTGCHGNQDSERISGAAGRTPIGRFLISIEI